ncbi:MAG: hypothetical protein BGP25_13075 [Lysobacterales bacterium 63-13]|nr:MAG: hypothetical protein BGP25_13075 [Xanthomonadales bacterium 63-13]
MSAFLFAMALASTAQAGTAVVVNGNFDTSLLGWDLSGTPAPTWSMLDYQNNPGSGSALLSNAEAQAGARLYPLRQCVSLATAGSHAIEADGFLPAGHAGGRLVVSFATRAVADCSGGANSLGGYFVQSNGSWVHGSMDFVVNPPFTYLDVTLGIEKDGAGGLLSGNFDAVQVIDRERIFANGFEVAGLP